MSDELKQCSKCGKWKPRTAIYFHRNKQAADGLRPDCIECSLKRHKTYVQEHKEELNEKSRQWRADNRDRHRAYSRQWERDHPEQIRERSRRWTGEKRDQVRDIKRTHRAKRRTRQEPAAQPGGDFTTAQWRALCACFEYRCVACNEKRPLTVDHVIPLSSGGTNTIRNVQPLCRHCNAVKAKQTTDYRDPDRLAAFLETHEL